MISWVMVSRSQLVFVKWFVQGRVFGVVDVSSNVCVQNKSMHPIRRRNDVSDNLGRLDIFQGF